jgi:NAD(P)-dependent dehydrogenase (short-subunit alcohol dehydrogenase family)
MLMTFERVLLIGASGGIGSALAEALAATDVTALSRSVDGLDLTDEASVAASAARIDGPFDLIFDATGALEIDGIGPEKTLDAIDPRAMAAQYAVNAIGPALLLKHFATKLATDRRSVFATLSARVGSIGDNRLGGWYGYRAAKAGLNQIVRTAAVEIARRRPQAIVLALHPGTVETALTEKYRGRYPVVTPAEAATNLLAVIAARGPEDSGGFFAWDGKKVPW